MRLQGRREGGAGRGPWNASSNAFPNSMERQYIPVHAVPHVQASRVGAPFPSSSLSWMPLLLAAVTSGSSSGMARTAGQVGGHVGGQMGGWAGEDGGAGECWASGLYAAQLGRWCCKEHQCHVL